MRRGFTLIELLVVVIILGILATVGLTNYRFAQLRGRDAQRKSDLKQIASAVELYYQDYQVYPNAALLDPGHEFTDGKTTYLKKVPVEPVKGVYFYRRSTNGNMFQVFAHLENSQDKNLIVGSVPGYADCGTGWTCNFAVTSSNTTETEVLP